MSSQFSSPFLIKSPLKAYVSTAGHFARMQDKISSATINALGPKTSNCKELRDNWHGGKMTDKAYADASKDCGKTKGKKLSVNKTKEALEKIGATTTDDKNDPYNLTAKMEKNPGLTNKQSIEERVGEDLSGKFNVGNTYQ